MVSPPGYCPARWTTVRFPTWRCPTSATHAGGQLSDSERGAVQRGWNLLWNPGARCNRPIGGGFPRFQVQPDNIGHPSTDCLFLYTGMTPGRPVQFRCPIRDDSQVPAFGGPGQPAGAIIELSDRLKVGAPPAPAVTQPALVEGDPRGVTAPSPCLIPHPVNRLVKVQVGRNRTLHGIARKFTFGPQSSPVSGSKWPRLVFLQLASIHVHGYNIEPGPGRVPEG